jgi:hypothetical protein
MSLTTLTSVQKLQMALHAKAKESPDFRFYALYDKVYRKDVLVYAYQRCKANGGAAGVDHQTFEDIEEYGVERWLDELAQKLKSRTYQPQPVRRVFIPKPDGKQRPLGIPTIRDRVVQTTALPDGISERSKMAVSDRTSQCRRSEGNRMAKATFTIASDPVFPREGANGRFDTRSWFQPLP